MNLHFADEPIEYHTEPRPKRTITIGLMQIREVFGPEFDDRFRARWFALIEAKIAEEKLRSQTPPPPNTPSL